MHSASNRDDPACWNVGGGEMMRWGSRGRKVGTFALAVILGCVGIGPDAYAQSGGNDEAKVVTRAQESTSRPAEAANPLPSAGTPTPEVETPKGQTASKPFELKELTVFGTPVDAFLEPVNVLEPTNKESFTRKSIDTFSGPGNMNVLRTIEMSPSVNYSPVDVLGTNESSFHDSLRIRGRNQSGPGNPKTVEGLPIFGNPAGGKTMLDLENIQRVDLYKGYIPVDKGLGFSNLIGKIDMNIRRPEHTVGAVVSQTFGDHSLFRTFLRADTGDIGKLSAYGSFSETLSNKYKGEGDLERTNGSLGLVYNPTGRLKAEVFVTHNKDDHNNYYNLTYAETQDLNNTFYKDFNTNTSNSNYYDYNKQRFETTNILANLEASLSSDSKISCKPYYLYDNGDYWYASGANVIGWDIDHELFGGVLKYEKNFLKELNFKLGYWEHWQQPPGPPTAQRKYTVGTNGLNFAGYAVLADNDYHKFHSPFTELSGEIGHFTYSAGIRYLNFKLGALRSYTNGTNASTSQDHDQAIANGTLDPWATVGARYFDEWLPSIYLGYEVYKDLTLYADYSRTYGLDVNLFPTYVQQRANFVAKGVTLQGLWDKLELETSDNIDYGVKYKLGDIYVNPNGFVYFIKNKQARIYDSTYGVTYPYNGADAFAYGFELSATGPITKHFEFLLAASYNRYYYTDNILTASNTSMPSKGNQVPDAPVYMAKAALTYRLGDFTLTPVVRYMSARYGDVLNIERIGDNVLVDLELSYRMADILCMKALELNVGATNLFNSKYVSTINTADNALAATNTAATYQTGAPFGIYANIRFMF